MTDEMMKIPMTAEIKAFLLSIGTADIEENLILPTLKSTAGPSAGSSGSIFISSNGKRVRLNLDKDSPIKIQKMRKTQNLQTNQSRQEQESPKNQNINSEKSDDVAVYFSDETSKKIILTGKIETALAHCPEQAYVTLSEKCVFDCKYCPVPILQGKTKTKAEVIKIIDGAFRKGSVKAVSITSGVEETPAGELKRVLELIPELKKYNVPIGVSIYTTPNSSKELKEAGVSEVKYNIEVADSEIFKNVCPGLSETDVFFELEEAVRYFGRGKVFSNLIIGLGESDEKVEQMIEKMAALGVIVCLRPIYENPLRLENCFMERPSKERLLKLFAIQKRISQKYELFPEKSETMCSLCTGCDLVPGRDD